MEQSFALFIDNLRKSRNISKPDFVKDIISERQYHRFLKGESSLKSDVLIQMFEKLEISMSKAFHNYSIYSSNQSEVLNNIYIDLQHQREKVALDKLKKIDKSSLTSQYDKKLYRFIKICASGDLNLVSKKTVVEEIIDLIDYPTVMSKSSITNFEVTGLMYIAPFLLSNGDKRIASFAYDIIIQSINSNDKIHELTYPFYTTTVQSLGKIGNFRRALKIANIGIDEYSLNNDFHVYEGLLYLKALAERELDLERDYLKTLSRLFAQLHASGNNDRFEKYESLLKSKFGLKVSDLIVFKY